MIVLKSDHYITLVLAHKSVSCFATNDVESNEHSTELTSLLKKTVE